jgi:hypothetical protein
VAEQLGIHVAVSGQAEPLAEGISLGAGAHARLDCQPISQWCRWWLD